MPTFILLLLISSVSVAAQDPACGPMNREWGQCKTASDCTVVNDGCGIRRIATAKVNASAVEKYYACTQKKTECPANVGTEKIADPIVKCDSYGIKGGPAMAGAKTGPAVDSKNTVCVRLGDVVGMAIQNADRKRLEMAVSESKDLEMSLSHIHETPLTLSAMNARTELVGWLIKKGAKLNFQTTNGYTALMFAAMSRDSDKKAIKETVQLLLKAGADKSLRNTRGESALDQAVIAKNSDLIALLK